MLNGTIRVMALWLALEGATGSDPLLGQAGSVPERRAGEIEDLVDRAATRIEAEGRRTFTAFRQEGSPWRHGELYLFVLAMDGRVLLNAGHPEREGRNLMSERDADGRRFHRDFVGVVQAFGSGWVDYMFPRPGRTVPEPKWSYVRGTSVDGEPALVGAGVYLDRDGDAQ